MKIFISHQRLDSDLAARIKSRLQVVHQITSYLDVVDSRPNQAIEDVADLVRREMSACSHLLAVVSPATAQSQWVPWEVGMATEKELPLATFSGQNALPPEFLRKWPYLRTDAELDAYARAAKSSDNTFALRKSYLAEGLARKQAAGEFYRVLRSAIGQ